MHPIPLLLRLICIVHYISFALSGGGGGGGGSSSGGNSKKSKGFMGGVVFWIVLTVFCLVVFVVILCVRPCCPSRVDKISNFLGFPFCSHSTVENKTDHHLNYQVIPKQRSVVPDGDELQFNDEEGTTTIVRLSLPFSIPQRPTDATAKNESPNSDSVVVQIPNDITPMQASPGENSHVCISVDKLSSANYFEITAVSNEERVIMAIGLTTNPQQSSEDENERLPGTMPNSFGYRSDDSKYDSKWGAEDTVGCGYDCNTKRVFFTKNGNRLSVDSEVVSQDTWFPTIGVTGPCRIKIIVGSDQFKYSAGDCGNGRPIEEAVEK